ncbi:MAG: hypothetical protein F4180_04735, partial [Chloroflexi bacterium]|nr:hypothetical protein [Chloroflexota bacterium]
NLGNNGLTGMIPANLFSAHMPVLEHLYLNDNRFSGAIPPNWGNTGGTYHLTHLYLNGNEFGSGPLENDLSGTDTSFLFQLTRLTHLDLSDNNLGGIIRGEYFDTQSSGPTWADLSQLEYLNLSDNHLTGGIPTTLERATAAKEIDLSGNRLTGDIVGYFETGGLDDLNNLSGLSNLERLYLNDNQLSGTISAQLGNLTNLQELWLHNNALTGEVPSELSELTMLRDIRVHGNMLTGGYEVVIGLTGLESVGLPTELFADSGRWIGNSFLNLSLPSGADPSQSSVTLTPVSLDPEDVHVPSHPGISRIVRVLSSSAVEIVLEYRDAEGNLLEGIPGAPAVVCIPVPAEEADEELVLLKSDDGGATWTALARADIYADSAVCGMTDSFSLFVPAVAEGVLGFRGAGGTGGLIGRIEPSIRDVTVSQGDTIRLSFDIYGRQDILNNDLGIGHVFIWDDGGAGGSIRTTDRANTITYTAPSSPGTHVVTATSPRIACLIGEDAEETAERCNAKFTIKVRRPSAVPEERPAPKNPVGEIPSVLADAEGRQYDVFTPEQGGFFDDGEVTLSAEPGVVPNLEIVGARVDAAGPASNVGMTRQRYTLVGDRYDVLAVDATETSISSYVLNAPLEVCVPLPPEARHDLSNVAIVVNNPDGTLTVLSASVRITQAGINVCGNLGTLPASIAVGTAGSPDAIPTAVPDPDEIADPDTGGYAPSRNGLLMLVMMMIVGGVIVLGGVLLARRRQNV